MKLKIKDFKLKIENWNCICDTVMQGARCDHIHRAGTLIYCSHCLCVSHHQTLNTIYPTVQYQLWKNWWEEKEFCEREKTERRKIVRKKRWRDGSAGGLHLWGRRKEKAEEGGEGERWEYWWKWRSKYGDSENLKMYKSCKFQELKFWGSLNTLGGFPQESHSEYGHWLGFEREWMDTIYINIFGHRLSFEWGGIFWRRE